MNNEHFRVAVESLDQFFNGQQNFMSERQRILSANRNHIYIYIYPNKNFKPNYIDFNSFNSKLKYVFKPLN